MAVDRVGWCYSPQNATQILLASGLIPFYGPWSDVADLPFKPTLMHVSVAGNIKYNAANGTAFAIAGKVEAFEIGWHPVRFDRIWLNGTTATISVWAPL